MRVIETIAEMQYACRALRLAGDSLGVVPTMGALHEGHLSLVRAARATCNSVAASIFVNPTQFAPGEDLGKYPRTFAADCAALELEGVDLLFAPSVVEMYPPGAGSWVEVAEIGDRLDGVSRPGHFRGVATVVAKLFHIFAPSHAFFGQKDAVQLAVIRRMVRDLSFDLEIVACPIVREADGLAMSSRNRYLSPEDRRRAAVISRALRAVDERAGAGETKSAALLAEARRVLAEEPLVRVEYAAVVDPETLEGLEDVSRGSLAAIAAVVGSTRLIDNLLLEGGPR